MTEKGKIAQPGNFVVEVEEGKTYYWCQCGESSNQPFCDGAHKEHKGEDGKALMRSVVYEATESKTVYFCGCKHSKNGVLCDGAHNKI